MSKAVPHPHEVLVDALNSDELKEALPRIAAYTAGLLHKVGWAEGRDYLPCTAQAAELVNEAIELALEGSRQWNEESTLEAFLCGIIRSLVSHKKDSFQHRRISGIDLVAELTAPSSRRDDRLGAHLLLSRISAAIADDPEITTLFSTIKAGAETPADQAAALDWTPERVRAVTTRMRRRLAAAGLDQKEDDDGSQGDGSPPGSPPPRKLSRRSAA